MLRENSMDWESYSKRPLKDLTDWEYYSRRGLKLSLEEGKIYFTKDKDALLVLKALGLNKHGHMRYRVVSLYDNRTFESNEFSLMSLFYD